jgi:U3 small nucleolar RNA-associated protein 11
MVNAKAADGVHRDLVSKKQKDVLTPEQISLLQTQDLRYVTHKLMVERRKIEKLKSTLQLLDPQMRPPNTHTLFVDSDIEKRQLDIAERLDTDPAVLGRAVNRPHKKSLLTADPSAKCDVEGIQKRQQKSYKQLCQRIEREKQLSVVEEKMRGRGHLVNARTKPLAVLKDETLTAAPVVVWRKERQR